MASSSEVQVEEGFALVHQCEYTYLDVRTKEEFDEGHYCGAVHIPVMLRGPDGMAPNPEFISAAKEAFPKTDTKLLVGCKSGRRSAMAIEQLKAEGYQELVNLAGGYDAWQAAHVGS